MFSIYLYLVLILIILIVLYVTQDQILISIKETKKRLENQTYPVFKSNDFKFVPSLDQQMQIDTNLI